LLAKEYWGKGLATEAAIAIRNYGFDKLNFNRLISLIDHGNTASQRVALKNGMTYEKDITTYGKIACIYAIHEHEFS
jgi:ribosomal-protein-alanine N-acetyltransferase